MVILVIKVIIKSEKVQKDEFGTLFFCISVLSFRGSDLDPPILFSSVAVLRYLLDIGSLPQVED